MSTTESGERGDVVGEAACIACQGHGMQGVVKPDGDVDAWECERCAGSGGEPVARALAAARREGWAQAIQVVRDHLDRAQSDPAGMHLRDLMHASRMGRITALGQLLAELEQRAAAVNVLPPTAAPAEPPY